MLTQGAVEYKSVKDVPPANFLEQFGKDLKNSEVSDLSQIKWIFDGKKVTQDELTNAVNNVSSMNSEQAQLPTRLRVTDRL